MAILNQDPQLDPPIQGDTATVHATRPSGTVTLLISDIEGFTRLWERARDAMADDLKLTGPAGAEGRARFNPGPRRSGRATGLNRPRQTV
jgi:hypothetical protein